MRYAENFWKFWIFFENFEFFILKKFENLIFFWNFETIQQGVTFSWQDRYRQLLSNFLEYPIPLSVLCNKKADSFLRKYFSNTGISISPEEICVCVCLCVCVCFVCVYVCVYVYVCVWVCVH